MSRRWSQVAAVTVALVAGVSGCTADHKPAPTPATPASAVETFGGLPDVTTDDCATLISSVRDLESALESDFAAFDANPERAAETIAADVGEFATTADSLTEAEAREAVDLVSPHLRDLVAAVNAASASQRVDIAGISGEVEAMQAGMLDAIASCTP